MIKYSCILIIVTTIQTWLSSLPPVRAELLGGRGDGGMGGGGGNWERKGNERGGVLSFSFTEIPTEEKLIVSLLGKFTSACSLLSVCTLTDVAPASGTPIGPENDDANECEA